MIKKIVSDKKKEVEQNKKNLPIFLLKERLAQNPKPLNFAYALRGKNTRLIAEVKKASPSRGSLCSDFNAVGLARAYEASGAAAISVITEAKYFLGGIDYLSAIRAQVKIPLLRKDFIFDEYQVYESAVYGADALLLIASILSKQQLEELMALSRSLGLNCLVEVHDEKDIEKALISGADIIGINNRDLKNFKVDLETTRRLRSLIPEKHIVVSESGVFNRDDVKKLAGWDVNAILIGEALVTANDVPAKIKELIV